MRLRIVGVLAEGGQCVCDLHEQVPVAANLVSYHLRVLRDARLVIAARRGRWVDYHLDRGGFLVLARVRYSEIGRITADRQMMTVSLALNWVVNPAVMFALAWLLLPDQPAYRTGVILNGLARCIAMVLIWTDVACGDREMATVLVALNAVSQVLLYAALGFFYLRGAPGECPVAAALAGLGRLRRSQSPA